MAGNRQKGVLIAVAAAVVGGLAALTVLPGDLTAVLVKSGSGPTFTRCSYTDARPLSILLDRPCYEKETTGKTGLLFELASDRVEKAEKTFRTCLENKNSQRGEGFMLTNANVCPGEEKFEYCSEKGGQVTIRKFSGVCKS